MRHEKNNNSKTVAHKWPKNCNLQLKIKKGEQHNDNDNFYKHKLLAYILRLQNHGLETRPDLKTKTVCSGD